MLSRIKRFVLKLLYKGQTRRLTPNNSAVPKPLRFAEKFYLSYRPDWDVEFGHHPEFNKLAPRWIANNVSNNTGDMPRLYSLILNISQVIKEGVAGDLAELGVYRGNSAAVLAHYAKQHDRSVFLFDTFTGFDQRDAVGVDSQVGAEFADTSLDMVRETVDNDGAIYVKGFFPDTVTEDIACRKFAVVHLDCDLYEPMKAGLEFFYPRLSPGGLIIFHDYSNPYWEGAKRAVDEYLPQVVENLVLLPDKSGTAILRKIKA